MSSRRKLDTSLFRSKEDIEQEAGEPDTGDMSPPAQEVAPPPPAVARRQEPQLVPDSGNPILKRASFDLREDQIWDLSDLKNRLNRQGRRVRISDLAREAVDDLLAKYG